MIQAVALVLLFFFVVSISSLSEQGIKKLDIIPIFVSIHLENHISLINGTRRTSFSSENIV